MSEPASVTADRTVATEHSRQAGRPPPAHCRTARSDYFPDDQAPPLCLDRLIIHPYRRLTFRLSGIFLSACKLAARRIICGYVGHFCGGIKVSFISGPYQPRLLCFFAPLLTACDPVLSVEGSFWPAWIVCILAGLAASILLMWQLVRLRLAAHMGPPLLIAPSLWALCTFVLWLVFYAG